MNCTKKDLLLYAVTDRRWLENRSLVDDVEKTLQGGVTMLQLREKNLTSEAFYKEALSIKDLCKKYNVPFIINDAIDIAIKTNADGVHIGQKDGSVKNARKKIGPTKILGVSAQTKEQALLAEKNGADYIGVGAVFSTTTKNDADNVSFKTLQDICKAVSIPVCAIGGITKENAPLLNGSIIDGIAVVSALFAQKNKEKASKNLLKTSQQIVLSSIKGALFDLDGTLLDSMPLWDTLAYDFLDSIGIKEDISITKTVAPMSVEEATDFFIKKYALTTKKSDLIAKINTMIDDFYSNRVTLKEGVKELLEKLQKKNIPLYIVTASQEKLAKKALKKTGIDGYFEAIFTSEKTGLSKKDGKLFEKAQENLECSIKETLVFEDAYHAIKGASIKGFPVIALYDESSKKDEPNIKKHAFMYAKTMNEIKDIL